VVVRGGWVYLRRPQHPRRSADGYVKRADLVAEAMLGRRLRPAEVVLPRNGQRDDDRPENLVVVDRQSAVARAHRSSQRGARRTNVKLTEDQVRAIRALNGTKPLAAIARAYDISIQHVRNILSGKVWRTQWDLPQTRRASSGQADSAE
jgi:hypothetical protein